MQKIEVGLLVGSCVNLLIFNFIINSCLIKFNTKFLKIKKVSIFNGIKTFFQNRQNNIVLCERYMLCYLYEIIVITNNQSEIHNLVRYFKVALNNWNIFLSKDLCTIINYNVNKKSTIKYLGFDLSYIPKSRVKYYKLRDKKLPYKIKDIRICPSMTSLIDLKEKLKRIIDTLLQNNLEDVITKCNKLLLR